MSGIEEMLRKFVSPDGTLRAEPARPFLNVIGDNLLHVRTLTPTNVSAIFWQRPRMRWPVFSRAAREANLELLPECRGKGAWIMVPRDREAVNEMDAASRQGAAAAREAAHEAAGKIEDLSGEMRQAASAAQDEKGRVAEALRQAISQVKTDPAAAAKVSDLKRSLKTCDDTAKDGFNAADRLSTEATRLRAAAAQEDVPPRQLAGMAEEVGLALVEVASETERVNEAHAALGRTARLARGERRRCTGEVVRFDQVRCVYDLERDFVSTPALQAVLRARQNPAAGARENARALAACLRARNGDAGDAGAEGTEDMDPGTRVTTLAFNLVKSLGAESEASPGARTLATYFVARALGGTINRLPAVRIAAAPDREEVVPRDTLNALREAIGLARHVLGEVVKTRGEQATVTGPDRAADLSVEPEPERAPTEDGEEVTAVAAPVARSGRGR